MRQILEDISFIALVAVFILIIPSLIFFPMIASHNVTFESAMLQAVYLPVVFMLMFMAIYFGLFQGLITYPFDRLRCWRSGHVPKRKKQLVYETCNLGHKHHTGRYMETDEWYCGRCFKDLQGGLK